MTTRNAWLAIALCSAVGLFVQCNTRTPVGEIGQDGGSPGAAGSGGAGTMGIAGTTGFAGGLGIAGTPTGLAGSLVAPTGLGGNVTCPMTMPVTNLFLAPQPLATPTTSRTTAVGVADLDGDGVSDVLVGGLDVAMAGGGAAGGDGSGKLRVFLANKAGGFAPAVSYDGPDVYGMGAADLNGDKQLDLVTTGSRPGIALRLNQGGGALGAATPYGGGSYAWATADLDGDGNAELLFATAGGLVVWKWVGGSNYSSKTYDEGFNAGVVATGELDGVPGTDVVLSGQDAIHLLFNVDGTAAPTATMTLANPGSWNVSLVDLDGDGMLDLVANSGANGNFKTNVFFNLGGAQFAVARQLPLNGRVLFGDLDGDGKPDAVVINDDCAAVTLSLNDGHGSFSAPSYIASSMPGSYNTLAALGDVNGDKALDLITANENQASVNVRLHRAP